MSQLNKLSTQKSGRVWAWRVTLILILQVVALLVLSVLMGSVRVDTLGAGMVAVLVIGFLSAIVWPFAVRYTLTLMVLSVGLFSFLLNAVTVWLSARLVPGFEIDSLWGGFVVAVVVALVSGIAGSALSLDDDDSFRRSLVKRATRNANRIPETDEPGVMFIQIDGLSHEILAEALESGHVPTLKGLLESGSHKLVPWECDLSSQTGAMQAGILLGNNENMPAFRWYDKGSDRILVSNSPKDAAEIEQTQSSGSGLLADGGASRGNVFSGDADDVLYTFSQLKVGGGPRNQRLVSLFATPYGLFRIIGLFVAEVWREVRSARQARREHVEPHGHRGGVYPLLRAAVTIGLAEITTATLAGDIYRGVRAAYADYVGYDEVAHHSGIRRPESMESLRRIDDYIRRLTLGFPDAPRPYEIVVLSDHGQTQGATFLQRYGETLESVVTGLSGGSKVIAPAQVTEGWGNVNGLLTDVIEDDNSFAGRSLRRVLKKRTHDGEVELGPQAHNAPLEAAGEIVVLASGNLGLVSFAEFEQRASVEQVEAAHPGLIEGLVRHEGIGFIVVHSELDEAGVVLGSAGIHHLKDGSVEGIDPLLPFGPNAARHLRRTDKFTNCPDLIVNSFFDPVADEGAAFEELIGFHGGLGGLQASPFLLVPEGVVLPDAPIVGAEQVHHVLKDWMTGIRSSPQPVRT